jgi:hypothetical protein
VRTVVAWGAAAALGIALFIAGAGDAVPREAVTVKRPNIVVILTDDHRWDEVRHMPELDSAPEWARFTNAFVHEWA